tara:strand:- start:232 stop:489 length:258 start_codon:yes stop_codon:yes gene_type:complete
VTARRTHVLFVASAAAPLVVAVATVAMVMTTVMVVAVVAVVVMVEVFPAAVVAGEISGSVSVPLFPLVFGSRFCRPSSCLLALSL